MLPFAVRLAWRESRAGLRRVGLYGTSIGLGVAALVAVHSFREDVSRSIRSQARSLLGADVELQASAPLESAPAAVIDSLVATGHASATVVTSASMVSAPASGRVRLLQVRGVEGSWPFYGELTTRPAGAWTDRSRPGTVLVDPAVLSQLEVAPGDSLSIGTARFVIRGTVEDLPTDLGFETVIGARVWMSLADLRRAGILVFGSLARYQVFLRMPAEADQVRVRERYADVFRASQVRYTTAEGRARDLTRAVGFLARFLGLVGLGGLLLGGLGVASAIHVFVKSRVSHVAMLRCLGGRQNQLFGAYLLQAVALGLVGSIAGAALGVGVQYALPGALANVLPVDVSPRVSWLTLATGVGIGIWVSAVFALLPLLALRDVPPLRALRSDVEAPPRAGRLSRALALAGLAASVLTLAVAEAPSAPQGVAFALALGVVTAALWGLGRLSIALARRLFPQRAPYVFRQGFANLFRPGNQTVAVMLALGFGAFVIGTVLQVQVNLGRGLSVDRDASRPNLLFFDVQPDQTEGVLGLLSAGPRADAEVTPLVPGRLRSVGGRPLAELLAREPADRPPTWALVREYRHTWRAELTDAERLVAGEWWPRAPSPPSGVARVSLELGLAKDLGVGVGDSLTWSIGGQDVPTRITSLREVDWGRFQTNFFVVFEPGSLDGAPTTWVVLARIDGEQERTALQSDLVARYPNVSVLDVSRIQEAVDAILERVDRAARALAALAGVAGLLVLAGALGASRSQRSLEGALLRALGARSGQIRNVLLSELVSLAALASAVGLSLAVAAAALLTTAGFGLPFRPSLGALVGIWASITALTLSAGMLGGPGWRRKPALPLLRSLGD